MAPRTVVDVPIAPRAITRLTTVRRRTVETVAAIAHRTPAHRITVRRAAADTTRLRPSMAEAVDITAAEAAVAVPSAAVVDTPVVVDTADVTKR